MAPRKASTETAAEKKPVEKKAAEKKAAAPKAEAPARKTTARKPAAKKAATEVIVQSPLGGEISYDEILAKVGQADKIYVRVDQNKAYWVRGEETGDVDLW